MDPHFKHLLSMLPPVNIHTGPWITGGSARRLWEQKDWQVGDVDVFFANDRQRAKWCEEFGKTWNYPPCLKNAQSIQHILFKPVAKHTPQAYDVMETDNAITFDINYDYNKIAQTCKMQMIKVRQAPSLMEIWSDFDFNVCCFAVDFEFLYADEQALQDLETNTITCRNINANKNRAPRIMKHFSQGYHVDDGLLLQAFKQICDKDVDWCNNY